MPPSSRQASIRPNLELRAAVIDAVRQYFKINAYLEIETPIRQPTQAPEEHIEAVTSGDWFLQTSPELCMKRLLASGYDRIFQICRCFRGRERGGRHLPEMTLLEWYTVDTDYHEMMAQTEDLIRYVMQTIGMNAPLHFEGHSIHWTGPWERITVADAFCRYGSLTVEEALATGRFDEILTAKIEPYLGIQRPTFLMDYPAKMGALARLSPTDQNVAERFELYIGGIELCNAFSELCDPIEQRRRFENANRRRSAAGTPPYPMPEKFLDVLKEMPPAAGNALGLDRLVMLLADTNRIGDVVAFITEEL